MLLFLFLFSRRETLSFGRSIFLSLPSTCSAVVAAAAAAAARGGERRAFLPQQQLHIAATAAVRGVHEQRSLVLKKGNFVSLSRFVSQPPLPSHCIALHRIQFLTLPFLPFSLSLLLILLLLFSSSKAKDELDSSQEWNHHGTNHQWWDDDDGMI